MASARADPARGRRGTALVRAAWPLGQRARLDRLIDRSAPLVLLIRAHHDHVLPSVGRSPADRCALGIAMVCLSRCARTRSLAPRRLAGSSVFGLAARLTCHIHVDYAPLDAPRLGALNRAGNSGGLLDRAIRWARTNDQCTTHRGRAMVAPSQSSPLTWVGAVCVLCGAHRSPTVVHRSLAAAAAASIRWRFAGRALFPRRYSSRLDLACSGSIGSLPVSSRYRLQDNRCSGRCSHCSVHPRRSSRCSSPPPPASATTLTSTAWLNQHP